MKTICIDIDGTISRYIEWVDSKTFGEVLPHAFHANGYGADYLGFRVPRKPKGVTNAEHNKATAINDIITDAKESGISEVKVTLPDGEYGSSFRMFNKVEHCYDVVYTCDHAMKRLCFTKQGDRLVGKVLSEENAYWIFSDITPDSFRWENVRIKDNGEKYLLCVIFGKRTA